MVKVDSRLALVPQPYALEVLQLVSCADDVDYARRDPCKRDGWLPLARSRCLSSRASCPNRQAEDSLTMCRGAIAMHRAGCQPLAWGGGSRDT